MSKEENFNQVYKNIIDEYDNVMELSRKKAKVENRYNMLILCIIVLINIVLDFGFFKLTNTFSFEIAGLLITASTAIFAVIKHRRGKSKIEKYASDFKVNVIGMMVKSFKNGFEFTPSERIVSRSIW